MDCRSLLFRKNFALKRATALIMLCAAALLASSAAYAQTPRLIAQYDGWASYVLENARANTCYVMGEATNKTPAGLNHGEVYLMVSRRPAEKIQGEVMLRVGYRLKDGSSVKVEVGKLALNMYTREDGAWLRESAEDARLVKALRSGSAITLKAVSAKGNTTSYRFSLKGISAALDAMNKACS